jgi:hypothetical protein
VKSIRWSRHALRALAEREIDRAEADKALENPEFVVPGQSARQVFMHRYHDGVLQAEMLLRVIVEETADEIVVITVYKTSQIDKYLKGRVP